MVYNQHQNQELSTGLSSWDQGRLCSPVRCQITRVQTPGYITKKPVGFLPHQKTHLKNMSALLFVLPIIQHFIQFIVAEASKLLT